MRDNITFYNELEKFIPNHKLGFKILKDEQLKNIFPSYEVLIDKITHHREKLNEHNRIKDLDSQYNLMYDNIYSIMGKRGSGKTSALFTLKKKIEIKFSKDRVLPVIMPEMIPDNAEIIGWVLATLEGVVNEVEEKLKSNRNIQHEKAYFRDCQFIVNNELREAYERVKELHFSKKVPNYTTESFSVATGSNEMQTLNSFEFAKELSKFWDVLVDAIAKAETDSKEENPLIYLMFDDVDLTPNRIMELLSTIIKYLAHPNLIVIITAEESLFYDVVSNELGKNLNNETMRTTAQLYIDKVMPPSSRFYLERFDDCRKKRSFIQTIETEDKQIEEKNLEEFLCEQVDAYIKARVPKKYKEYDNFLYYQGKKKQFLQTYFMFWGNTSRQLVNESLIVSDLISSLIRTYKNASMNPKNTNKEEYIEQVYDCIQGFIRRSIKSNMNLRNMVQDVDQFVYELCSRNKTRWPIFINYEVLWKFYFDKIELSILENTQEELLKNVISIFVLLFFSENILLIDDQANDKWSVSKDREYVHGVKHLVEILDSLLPETLSLIRNSRTNSAVAELLYSYENILCNPMWLKQFSLYRYLDVKDYLYPLYSADTAMEISASDLYRWNIENPRWFTTMTKMIFLMASGIYSLNRRTTRIFQWRDKIKVYDSYLSLYTNLGKEELRKQLSDSYQYILEDKNKISYHTYSTLLHRTKIFEKLEEQIGAESDVYYLEEIKEKLMSIIYDDSNIQEKIINHEISDSNKFLRISCFLYTVKKEVWAYEIQTTSMVKSELRRVQNELIQNYNTLTDYVVLNKEDVILQLKELQELDLSSEILDIVENLIAELEDGIAVKTSAVNRLIELLNTEIEEDDTYLFGQMSTLKACRNLLIKNIRLSFLFDDELNVAINILIQHEALLHLQEIYLDLVLDEMKNMLNTQGIATHSFYVEYLLAMLDMLKIGEYGDMGQLRNESRPEVYLGKYMRDMIKEAVDEYFIAEQLVEQTTNKEVSHE